MQQVIHYFLHFIFPAFIAYTFYRQQWLKSYVILLLTMIVDADHLLAIPIYAPCRCSIGFHPLHSYVAIAVYIVCFFIKPTRLIATGLLLHMATDGIDCMMSRINC